MSDLTVARRYAQALHKEAEQAGLVEKADEDMAVVQESLEGSRELVQFFESPILSRDKKEAVVRQLFEKRLEPLTFRFLMLLVEKKREDLFPVIVRAYRDLRDEQLGITEAKIRTAQPLQEQEVARLQHALEDMTGRKVRLSVTVEPDLIGGLVIRVGDTVYDGSARHQLAALHEKLRRGVTIRPDGQARTPTNHVG